MKNAWAPARAQFTIEIISIGILLLAGDMRVIEIRQKIPAPERIPGIEINSGERADSVRDTRIDTCIRRIAKRFIRATAPRLRQVMHYFSERVDRSHVNYDILRF